MKKRVVSIMLSIALLLVLIPPDLAAAADDHANTLGSSATFINLNSTVSGVISPNTDVDWFRFSLPAAGSITIASTVSGGLDSYGYLYSSSQSLIASNDDLNGRAFGMSVNLPIGTYYIKVASYNGTSSGSYTLRITGTASSAGTSTPTPATTTSGGSATINPGAARSISVYSGVTGRVRISTTATVTGTYIFTSSGNGSYDPAAYNSNSSSASRIADDEAGSSNFRLSVNLSAGQAYSFYAGTYGNGAASYVVSVTAPATVYTYTVSYNANGGSGAPASQTKTQNAGLTLSSVRPTRSGYAFLGWSTGSAATSASYQPGGSYTANANVMLYAVWQAQAAASGAMTAIGAGSRTVSVVAGAPTRFAFTPPTTGTYTFSTSNNSGDPYLYLYSSSAMTSAYLLTSNDDISSSDRNSRISYNLNAGVTYYIGAGAY
ncbi:MAG: InlB B-repeat-containing protein, partial [Oscillospiraceae bacterium]|nr:InlB B-repeat-containing protein [Oscillospiraceae bacterium]